VPTLALTNQLYSNHFNSQQLITNQARVANNYLKQASQFQLTINHVIKLSTWRLSQISGYSYSGVTVIRINVHPAGKNPTNKTHTLLTPVHVRFLRTVPVHGNLPRATDMVGRSHCSREKGLTTQSPARRLIDPRVRTQFLSRANQWSSGESQTFINSKLLGLPDPYHRHAIGTFNTCSWGPIKRSLTDTGGGYNLEGVGLPHTHSLTFPTSCLPFSLVAPPGLQFNQVPAFTPNTEF
jgi:hypothetical protein